MSSISIIPVNIVKRNTKSSSLSIYGQKHIKSQAKSISYALDRFFTYADEKFIKNNGQSLKEVGLKEIGKNSEEGIIIAGNNCNYHLYLSNGEKLCINMLKSDINEAYQHFSLNLKNDKYIHAGDLSDINIEEVMSEVFDFIDNKLSEAKKVFEPPKLIHLFIPKSKTSKIIEELNRTQWRVNKKNAIKNFGFISTKDKEVVESIIEKFITAQEIFKVISDGHTRSKLRSSYKHYIPQMETNKLGFKNIGLFGEDITVQHISYNSDKYLSVGVINADGKELKLVISEDKGTIQRNLPYRFSVNGSRENRIYSIPDYYTQEEIDGVNIYSYLHLLEKELDLFIEHSNKKINLRDEKRLIRLNNDVATLEPYKDLLDEVSSSFEKYRAKMRKYVRKAHKSKKFKTENGISTKLASTAVKFDNITPDGYDLRLSYPKVHDKTATQLIVMQGDIIKKSFYILDNKLLRFNIKDLNDKFFNYNKTMYYYDNKYLQNSNLEKYFLLLRDKLHDLNDKLDELRAKQIQNRIRYNLKAPKEDFKI